MTLCLIDTSILLEFLEVPQKATNSSQIQLELEKKIKNKESLFLPMASVIETGNHIAQNGNGSQRRICAEKFVKLVSEALNGKAPFTPINFPIREDIEPLLQGFIDKAMQGISFGDFSIINEYNNFRKQYPYRKVYIWSLDQEHLQSYS